MNTETKIQKPFLKWVGGKTQIIDIVLRKFPKEMNNYHELFLGGGSVLFALLSLHKDNKIKIKKKIYAYDINKTLINVYKHIQKSNNQLYKYIQYYFDEYNSINDLKGNRKPETIEEAKLSKESYYYWMRNKFNSMEDSIEKSAVFIFINKTCFRGMYREGPNGFNVPFGNYKKPGFLTEEMFGEINILIKDVEFLHSDFESSIKNAKKGDFVYLDPPYAPKDETSFVGYVAKGFNLDMHKKLFKEINNFNMKEIKFALSNAKVNLVTDYFKGYYCQDILARRAINSKKPGSKTIEVIINN